MTKEKIQSARELEIPIYFHNYKLLKDKSFVLKGSHIYFVQGPNGVGKTTFLKALTSLQIASDDTTNKVSRGESEGLYEAKIPASDGSFITIRHEFTDNNKGKFIAIREDGSKISSVTEIRNLFNYTPINVDQFFAMSNTAEGRRKQRDIILKLLTDEEREEFNEFDLQEQHYYDQRTEINKEVEQADSSIKAIVIPKEDELLVPREEEAKKLIKLYGDIISLRKQKADFIPTLTDLNKRKENLENEIENKKKELEELSNTIKEGENTQSETDKILAPYEKFTDEELEKKIETGNNIITRITSISTKNELKKEWMNKWEIQKAKSDELTKKINVCRTKKTNIITSSDLPVENISFEDGFLTIDGFQFKENQVCESDAVLILANILAKINPGPIQVIGDASILDNEKLEKLNQIAEENNKIMFVDEVTRDANDIVVVGYEELSNKVLKVSLDKVARSKKETIQQEEKPEIPDKWIPPLLTKKEFFKKVNNEILF